MKGDNENTARSYSRGKITALSLGAVAALVVVAVSVGAFGIGPAASIVQAQDDTPTVSVEDVDVAPGETATADVTISSLPDGISGYDLNLTLDNPSVATFTDVTYPDVWGVTNEDTANSTSELITEDGGQITLKAADLSTSIQPGAGETVLGTVTVEGVEDGESAITPEDLNIDNETGSNIDAQVSSGTVTVGTGEDPGDTDTPEDNDTDAPEDNDTDTPEDNDTDTPEDNVTETPEDNVTENATVTFENQTSDGTTVTVDSVSVPEGGFVAIHNASLLDGNVQGSVVGVSEVLDNGTHEDVEVTLFDVPGQNFSADMSLGEDQTLIAMPHFDSNDNEVYDFITSNASEDGPYTANGSAVTDPAFITLEGDDGEDGMDDNDTDTPADGEDGEDGAVDGEDGAADGEDGAADGEDGKAKQPSDGDDGADDGGDGGKAKAGDDGGDGENGATDGGNGKSKMGSDGGNGDDGDDGAADGGNGKSKNA